MSAHETVVLLAAFWAASFVTWPAAAWLSDRIRAKRNAS
jgi:hypothetical protein